MNYSILGVGGKLKKDLRTLDIEFERDRSIGLGSTMGVGRRVATVRQTDRQDRQTHTHFL